MREKLIELLDETFDKQYDRNLVITARNTADHLIANGVTLDNQVSSSKWIPVSERLPDDSIPSTFYLCYWNGYIRACKYWRTRKVFELRGKTVKVTHWMPLPEQPKEES